MNKRLGFNCGDYLARLAHENSSIWVIDGDLADSDGALPFVTEHPERFIAAGIAEQNMVSMAAGMATMGIRPWVFSFAAFLCYRAYDQIRVAVSQAQLPVTLIGSHAGGCGGKNGKTHLALNDIAVMSSLPQINIWAPADANDVALAINNIVTNKAPAYIRLPRDAHDTIPVTSNEVMCWLDKPTKIAIISYGLSTHWALATQKILQQQGYKIAILHCNQIWPIDPKKISELLKNVQTAFVIEDHYEVGGLFSHLKTSDLTTRFIPMCWPNNWSGQSGTSEELLHCANLAPQQIAEKIKNYF